MAKKKKALSKKHQAENNKLLIILFLLLAFVLFIVYASIKPKSEKYSEAELVSAVKSSSIVIPDTKTTVSLENGQATFSADMIEGKVEISDPYFSVKTKNGYNLFTVMTYNTGGSGEFVNIALFYERDGEMVYSGSYPVGDRVIINSITKANNTDRGYEVSVNYLDRSPQESMVDDPTVPLTINFSVEDNKIIFLPDLNQ